MFGIFSIFIKFGSIFADSFTYLGKSKKSFDWRSLATKKHTQFGDFDYQNSWADIIGSFFENEIISGENYDHFLQTQKRLEQENFAFKV